MLAASDTSCNSQWAATLSTLHFTLLEHIMLNSYDAALRRMRHNWLSSAMTPSRQHYQITTFRCSSICIFLLTHREAQYHDKVQSPPHLHPIHIHSALKLYSLPVKLLTNIILLRLEVVCECRGRVTMLCAWRRDFADSTPRRSNLMTMLMILCHTWWSSYVHLRDVASSDVTDIAITY